MKRFKRAAALLLALSMLAAAGCTDKPEETSSAAESGSSDNSDTSSEPFVEPEVNEVRDTIDALYGTPADRSLKANNVLSGMLPAFSRPASSEYPGNGGKALTDGVRVQAFDSTAWVGFNGREPVTLTFDLGEVVDGLADFEVGAFKSEGYGIGLPTKVDRRRELRSNRRHARTQPAFEHRGVLVYAASGRHRLGALYQI